MEQIRLNPRSFLEAKRLFMNARVAGRWMKHDDTEESDRLNAYSPREWVRLTPITLYTGKESGIVASVIKRYGPKEPWRENPVYRNEPELYDIHMKKYERDLSWWRNSPFEWTARVDFPTRHSPLDIPSGFGPTLRAAMLKADDRLREDGWVLDDPDLLLLANEAPG
jgi:hypothetical protein